MAVTVYTERFFGIRPPAAQDTAVWGVPDDGIHEARDLVVANNDAAPQDMQLSYEFMSDRYILWRNPAVPAHSTAHVDLRQIIPAGSLVYVYISGQSATVLVTGYRFKPLT